MKLLYVAGAVEAFGTSGGSVHIQEVACGLKALGHDVRVICLQDSAGHAGARLACAVPVRHTRRRKELALLSASQVARAVARFRPDVIMERFYNFAGAGILEAHRRGIPALLEVNAPMVDPPGSLKTKVDRLMLGSMRRWAVQQGRWSAAIVTPLATTVPPEVPRSKIHELPWGANVERFDPAKRPVGEERAALLAQLGLSAEYPVAVFLGSFRRWHGVEHFAEAARQLLRRDVPISFLAIGGGPELEPLRAKVAGWELPPGRMVFTGAQPHERVPQLLGLANIGVAPFDIAAHPPLATFGFYWSPLKVFEYMAMQMPVVTIDTPPLNGIVRQGMEGCLYRAGDVSALAGAMERLAGDGEMRTRLGMAARQRVVANYSWQAHCRSLDEILRSITRA